jgi:plastocyanin
MRSTLTAAALILLAATLAATAAAPAGTGPFKAGAKADNGWGTLRGQIVFGGDKLPELKPLNVDKDQDHCLSKGPVQNESWVVNPGNKGVRWVVVFLRAEQGQTLPIHESLKEVKQKEVVLDQPACRFEPHVVALREGQVLVAKNPAPVAHNVVINGLNNSHNVQLAPGKSHNFTLTLERNALAIQCGIHPWMRGYAWTFDHPYYAVTDADGKFEIKLAPAGKQNLVIWHEATGYLEGKKGRAVDVKPGDATDLGKITIKPTE